MTPINDYWTPGYRFPAGWNPDCRRRCQGLAPEIAELFYKNIDYSHGRLCNIDETQLDEQRGAGLNRVDWDCDGIIDNSPVVHGVQPVANNSWCEDTASANILRLYADHNEWANISDHAAAKSVSELDNLPEVSCITSDEWLELQKALPACPTPQPPLTIEPCLNTRVYFVSTDLPLIGSGTCALPFRGLGQANTLADSGSIWILHYGTLYEFTDTLILDKPAILYPTHNAIIQPGGIAPSQE